MTKHDRRKAINSLSSERLCSLVDAARNALLPPYPGENTIAYAVEAGMMRAELKRRGHHG